MRYLTLLRAALASVAVPAAGGTLGCQNQSDDCLQTLTCVSASTSTSSSCSSGTGGHDGGIGGGDSGPPPSCIPSENAGAVADTCGVFVSPSGDDSNAGTKNKPLKTIGAAVAKGGAIYACAGAAPYTEAVTVDEAVTLYGALDCTTWAYDGDDQDAAHGRRRCGAADAGEHGRRDGGARLRDRRGGRDDSGRVVDRGADDQAGVTLEDVDVAAGKGAARGSAGMTQADAGGCGREQPGGADATCNMHGVSGGAGGSNSAALRTPVGVEAVTAKRPPSASDG